MNSNNTNLENKAKLSETKMQREKLLASCMAALATGLGVEITMQRVVLYQRPLADLTDSQIKTGFRTALKEFKPYGGSFPSPGELREYALRDMSRQGFPNDAPEILSWVKPERDAVSVEEIKLEIEKRNACGWPK